MRQSSIAVVVVNWNSGKYLEKCLQNLRDQTLSPTRVLVVDNASTDDSIDGLEQRFHDWEFIHLEKNTGFAYANNLAVKQVDDCDWVTFLNPDAFARPDWLEKLMSAVERFPDAKMFGSHMLGYKNDLIDGTGDIYHVSGIAWRRDHGVESSKIQRESGEIFSPCAAAALISRQVFLEAGGFDEHFYCYNEDVDLSFRLRLIGHRCIYVSDAIVEHVGSGTTSRYSDFAVYHGQRNLIWSYVRNMPGIWFWFFLPQHILFSLSSMIRFSLNGKAVPVFKARIDALKELPRIWTLRQKTQSSRTVSGRTVIRSMDTNFWTPYIQKKINFSISG
ncbi:MAG: glycosyltransferase family 2 protein [Nitrospinae bacterium]|nr:glycosyltransferase family 2 protein [Nitrospinota bacterium]